MTASDVGPVFLVALTGLSGAWASAAGDRNVPRASGAHLRGVGSRATVVHTFLGFLEGEVVFS